MTKLINFGQAEKNAKKRDFEIENKKFTQSHNEISKIELEQAIETMTRATGKDLYIGTKKSIQSKVRFVQFMQNNLGFLRQNKYLTAREKSFFIDITPLIAFDSNCIVEDILVKNPVPMNISQIADFLGTDRSNMSKIINSLKRKGLLFKGESGLEGNNAKAYAIFINPHIIYAGDKDNVNKALQVMFNKAMKMKILKDLPDKLF